MPKIFVRLFQSYLPLGCIDNALTKLKLISKEINRAEPEYMNILPKLKRQFWS